MTHFSPLINFSFIKSSHNFKLLYWPFSASSLLTAIHWPLQEASTNISMFNVADSWTNVHLKHETSHQGAKNSTRMISWSPILLSKSLSVNSSTSLACVKPARAAKTISLSIVAGRGVALLRSQQKGLGPEHFTAAAALWKPGKEAQPTEAEREQADLERERDGSGADIQGPQPDLS